MENNSEVVELLKKQVRATYLRNFILIVLVVVIAAFTNYMVKAVDQAMVTVQHIDELTNEISAEIESLDVDNLNATFENLNSITEELDASMKNFQEVSNNFAKLFRF